GRRYDRRLPRPRLLGRPLSILLLGQLRQWPGPLRGDRTQKDVRRLGSPATRPRGVAGCVLGFYAEDWSCTEATHFTFACAAFTHVSYTYFSLSRCQTSSGNAFNRSCATAGTPVPSARVPPSRNSVAYCGSIKTPFFSAHSRTCVSGIFAIPSAVQFGKPSRFSSHSATGRVTKYGPCPPPRGNPKSNTSLPCSALARVLRSSKKFAPVFAIDT